MRFYTYCTLGLPVLCRLHPAKMRHGSIVENEILWHLILKNSFVNSGTVKHHTSNKQWNYIDHTSHISLLMIGCIIVRSPLFQYEVGVTARSRLNVPWWEISELLLVYHLSEWPLWQTFLMEKEIWEIPCLPVYPLPCFSVCVGGGG